MTAGGRLLRVTVEGAALRQILLVLARHRRSIWCARHAAGSKRPSRYLVLGQPLFIGERFTNPVRGPVWFRHHHKNLIGLDCGSWICRPLWLASHRIQQTCAAEQPATLAGSL